MMTPYALVGDINALDPCAIYLSQFEHLQRIPLASLDELQRVSHIDVVVIYGNVNVTPDQIALLTQQVERGMTLVWVGTLREDSTGRVDLLRLLGIADGTWMPPTELIVRNVAPAHSMMQRFEPRWPLVDALFCGELATQVTPLLEVSWQMGRYPVAYMRSLGAGCIVATTLGATQDALRNPQLVEFVGRAVTYAADQRARSPLNVATIGFGAIGREHGDALSAVPGLSFAAVCDRNPVRLDAARVRYPSLKLYSDMEQLAAASDIDVVIVSTPPNTHAAVARTMLHAGKHVVVEKPFCLTTNEADQLIAIAHEQQRTLTVYQNRRWDADFLAIKEVVQDGTIGNIFHLETFIGGYGHPCDYWHSDALISGGVFYDWGSHYLDWILNLVAEPVMCVSATEHKRVWHDVTNADHSTIRLHFAHGVEAEFMHSDIAAALKPKWYVLGTGGAIVAEWRHETVRTRRWSGDLIEEQLQAAESPSRVTVCRRSAGDRLHAEELSLPPPPVYAFHRNLADHLLLGSPLAVSPASSRRTIAVMEAAIQSAREHGAWIEPR